MGEIGQMGHVEWVAIGGAVGALMTTLTRALVSSSRVSAGHLDKAMSSILAIQEQDRKRAEADRERMDALEDRLARTSAEVFALRAMIRNCSVDGCGLKGRVD